MWWRLALVGAVTVIVLALLFSPLAGVQMDLHALMARWSQAELDAEVTRFSRIALLTITVSVLSVLLASGLAALDIVRRYGGRRR